MKKIIIPAFRGLLKSAPGVGAVIEAVKNIRTSIKNANSVDKPEKLPHNWVSILAQLIGLTAIAVAYFKGALTLENLLELLKGLGLVG